MILHALAASLLAAAPPASRAPPLSAAEKAAAARVSPAALEAHTRFLSDDLLEGRLPGTRGDALAVQYIATQLRVFGLEPAGEGGTYFQKVPVVAISARPPAEVTFTPPQGGKPLALQLSKDLVISSGNQAETSKIDAAEVVFAGYGIVAPEYQWDDFKDADVRGKVLLVMNNDPSSDPQLFAGKTRLWYGRWDYKYEQAAKKGAVGAIVIHTTPSAAYPWTVVVSSWSGGAKFELPRGGEPRLEARLWATEDASKAIARLGGHDLDQLRAQAERRDFRPVPLGVKVSLSFQSTLRRLESQNVLGRLPGSDPALRDEVVVVTAHHDHLGKKEGASGEDTIYNGALDNASGVAVLLEMARAAAAGKPPRRSLLFAAVAAEEQGLLGSEWYCKNPTVAPGRMAANLNIDVVNNSGKTKDLGFIGYGKSSLDAVVEGVARAQGRTVKGDPYPDRGMFYRSDQFNFAKIGVPAIYARGGPTYAGRPEGWGAERATEYIEKHYHQPSDQVDGSWSWEGVVEDTQLLLLAGLRIANDRRLPAWKPGDEFEAARKKALAEVAGR